MSHRHNQLNMPASLTAYFFLGYFYTTTIADDTFVTNTLVFSASTFVIFCRTKNLFTKETVSLGFIRTIIDGFRLGDLTIRIFLDLLGRCLLYTSDAADE